MNDKIQALLDSFEKDEFDDNAWNYCGRVDPAEAEMQYAALKAESEARKDTLLEVVSWIQNWEPDFVYDAEWKETEKHIDDALKGRTQ